MVKETQPSDDIGAQAIAWFTQLRSDTVDSDDVARFNQWLTGHPQHQQAFQAVDNLWLASKDLQHGGRVAQTRQAIAQLKAEAAREKSSPRLLRPLAAAALLVVAVAVGWYALLHGQPETHRYFTGLGQRETISLPDGSTVTLNTRTTLEVSYSRKQRQINLLRGQANFKVTQDPTRPFAVTVDNSRIIALGTQFDIYKRDSDTLVTLLEGAVEVTAHLPDQQAPPQTAQLHPGEQIRITGDGKLPPPRKVDVQQISAWQTGRMNFDDTPLAKAIAEANRYTDLTLELADNSLANLPITGIFMAGQSEDFARAVENLHGVRLKWVGSQKIKIMAGTKP